MFWKQNRSHYAHASSSSLHPGPRPFQQREACLTYDFGRLTAWHPCTHTSISVILKQAPLTGTIMWKPKKPVGRAHSLWDISISIYLFMRYKPLSVFPKMILGWEIHRDLQFGVKCRRHGFYPWVRKMPWRRKWQPTSVFLPGKSHGQRRLVGYSPWGRRVRQDSVTNAFFLHFTWDDEHNLPKHCNTNPKVWVDMVLG